MQSLCDSIQLQFFNCLVIFTVLSISSVPAAFALTVRGAGDSLALKEAAQKGGGLGENNHPSKAAEVREATNYLSRDSSGKRKEANGRNVHVGYAASATTPEVVSYKWRIWKARGNNKEQDGDGADGGLFSPSSSSSSSLPSFASSSSASDRVKMERVTIAANLSSSSNTYPNSEVCLEAAMGGTPATSVTGVGAPVAAVTVSPCKLSADPDANAALSQQWYWGVDTTIRSALNTSLCVCSDPFRNRNDTRTFFEAFLAVCDSSNVWQRHAHESEAPGTNPASHNLWTGSLYFLVQEF